jgi:hypothetical protein
MKFPFLYTVFLLLAITAVLAGCSSSPSAPGTGTPTSGTMPAAAGTPVYYSELSQLVLSPAEMPFVVVDEKNQTPDLTKDPSFSRLGAIRGYTRYSINEKTDSATSVQLGQMIVEYPPGNATLAFAAFVQQNRNADQTQYQITWLQDPGIGDESCALTIIDRSGAKKPIAMIVFRKATIMESVVMIAPSPDIDALTRAARLAAAKIPP